MRDLIFELLPYNFIEFGWNEVTAKCYTAFS